MSSYIDPDHLHALELPGSLWVSPIRRFKRLPGAHRPQGREPPWRASGDRAAGTLGRGAGPARRPERGWGNSGQGDPAQHAYRPDHRRLGRTCFGGSDLGDVDVEVTDRAWLELALGGLVAIDVGQSADAVALKAAVQRRSGQVRDRRLQPVPIAREGLRHPTQHEMEEAAVASGYELELEAADQGRALARGAGWFLPYIRAQQQHDLEQHRDAIATGDHGFVEHLAAEAAKTVALRSSESYSLLTAVLELRRESS